MIEKLKPEIKELFGVECPIYNSQALLDTVNQLVDAVNKLETMAKNTNTVLESLVQENNIHEKQIDELQMKLEPEKCETPAENVQPDCVTTTYLTDGHTKEYYGQNGVSIITYHPLPAGYIITIRERKAKGGDNE